MHNQLTPWQGRFILFSQTVLYFALESSTIPLPCQLDPLFSAKKWQESHHPLPTLTLTATPWPLQQKNKPICANITEDKDVDTHVEEPVTDIYNILQPKSNVKLLDKFHGILSNSVTMFQHFVQVTMVCQCGVWRKLLQWINWYHLFLNDYDAKETQVEC